ncbi:alanine racemase [Canibacter zhoujuaniae]|uniref:alanine racemase n=1 Tax=Canibacter zhoujuaniae TaxID=2708343 RepID=UPI001FB9497C|nr:alanine racemase [Canibacter zhoujuaniae]
MRTGSMRFAEVSRSAIAHNVRRVQEVTGANVIAVLKANGYGHGANIAAEAALAGGARILGVADIEEALALREAGFLPDRADILCWLHGADADFTAAVAADIELGVSHVEQLEAVANAAIQLNKTAVLHLKLDTGLSRNGAGPEEWREFFARAAELESTGTVWVRGIFTHLANTSEQADLEQGRVFDAAVALARKSGIEPELLHVAASAASFTRPQLYYNAVRVGVAIYGLSPFADRTSAELGLRPALKLIAEIVALREVPAGTGVSYGSTYRTEADTVLALVPVGYADGMPRALNNTDATVSVGGVKRPIVGRIGMDQCVIDLGKELGAQARLGDRVVLFGDAAAGEPPVEEWSNRLHTINYEVIARLGARLHRIAAD